MINIFIVFFLLIMNTGFRIDTDKVIIYANKLERLSDKAFPDAVRGTLNGLAFKLKKDEMPSSANRSFVNREKNFFKANSRVDMAKGRSVRTMKSTFAFMAGSGVKNEHAVKDLEAQEQSGVIDGRKYIPVSGSRTSRNRNKRVRKANRLGQIGIGNIVNAKNSKGSNNKEKFVKAAIHAGKGGFVQAEDSNGVTMVYKVNSLKRGARGRWRWKFNLTPLYIVNDSKSVKIKKATKFMQKANNRTMAHATDIFIKEGDRVFNRYFGL